MTGLLLVFAAGMMWSSAVTLTLHFYGASPAQFLEILCCNGEWDSARRTALLMVLKVVGTNVLMAYLMNRWAFRFAVSLKGRNAISNRLALAMRMSFVAGLVMGSWAVFSSHVG